MSSKNKHQFKPAASYSVETITLPRPLPKPVGLQPCHTCAAFVLDRDLARCHLNPPQIRLPYDNMAAWPPVPTQGGGCLQHKEAT